MFKVEGATLWDLLKYNAETRENNSALLFPQKGVDISYGQLWKQAGTLAKGLIALGIQHGEQIAIWSPNSPEWLVLEYGSAAVGTPLVMINTSYRMLELEFALKQTDVVALFVADNQSPTNDYIETMGSLCPELLDKPPGEWKSAKFPKLRYVIGLGEKRLPGMLSWSEVFTMAASIEDSVFTKRKMQVSADDTVFILFTSGTTGEPSGAMLSHQNLLVAIRSLRNHLNFSEADSLCVPIPLFHVFGTGMAILVALMGSTCVICEQSQANQIVSALRTSGATVLCGTPTMFIGCMDALEKLKTEGSSLSKGLSAGASLHTETANRILERTTIQEIWNCYGATETIVVSGNRISHLQESELISTGSLLKGVEAKIVETAGERELAVGEIGELLLRSPGVMKGYYNKPEVTEKAIDAEGWYHSWDMAAIDTAGNISIVGRRKEMLIRGGENIFPLEIEEYLMSYPKVNEAQVVGIPSEYYGEEPVAFVILKAGETATQLELKKYCRERIAYFKVPVYVYFVDSFPKTASGKVQKFKLKEQAMKYLKK